MSQAIRLGQCWLVRGTKYEMVVRLDDYSPKGGWLARSLSHGRVVWIRKADQLVQRCDENGLRIVADETELNRRSKAMPPEPVEPKPEQLAVAVPFPKMPVREPEPVTATTLLDAAAIILKSNRAGMTTKEIIAAVQEKGLWNPTGKTPWLTLHTALSREIDSKGAASRFKRAKERGNFSLR